MIRTNEGKTKIEGDLGDVLADFEVITFCLRKMGIPMEVITECVARGMVIADKGLDGKEIDLELDDSEVDSDTFKKMFGDLIDE